MLMGEMTTDKGTGKMKREQQRDRQETVKAGKRYDGVRDKEMQQRDEEGMT